MARGRILSTSIAEDEDFNSMSIAAQFIFMRTIPHLDRDGLISGNPTLLHAKVAPLLPSFCGQMESIIAEWIQFDFVLRYKDGKRDVLFFIGFAKNQVNMRYDREGESSFAPPHGYVRTPNGLQQVERTESAAVDDNGGINSGSTPAEVRTNSPLRLRSREDQEEDKEKTKTNDKAETSVSQSSSSESSPVVVVDEKANTAITIASMADVSKLRKADTGFDAMCALYEREIEKLTPILANEIYSLRTCPNDWWSDAINIAVKAGYDKRKLSYIRGILNNWRSEGKGNGKPAKQGINAFASNSRSQSSAFGLGNGANHAASQSDDQPSGYKRLSAEEKQRIRAERKAENDRIRAEMAAADAATMH